MRRASTVLAICGVVWLLYSWAVWSTAEDDLVVALWFGFRAVALASALGAVVVAVVVRARWPASPSPWFLGAHTLAALAYGGAWVVGVELIESARAGQELFWTYWDTPFFGPRLVMGTWLYVAIAGAAHASTAAGRIRRAETRADLAEERAARNQLRALRAQLQPHFLFNALNSVASLVPVAPETAERAVESLSVLLRRVVDGTPECVPLEDEWQFVEEYLALEKLRLEERLQVKVSFAAATLTVPVPAFSLQTLVENAVRHGAAPIERPVSIEITAKRTDAGMELAVVDDGPGANPAALSRNAGVGLAMLRQRIETLYGESAELATHTGTGEGFSARLSIPIAGITSPPGSKSRSEMESAV